MKILANIIFWVTTFILILAIVAVTVPRIFGIEYCAVKTGSMEPEIPVGSLVVIVPTKAEDINIGDDITFVSASGKLVTHRVIEIDREKNTFTTYGIANGISNKDEANRYENIVGVVRYHVPVIGRLFIWLSSTTGKIIAITAIVVIYLITALLSVLFGKKKEPEEITLQSAAPEPVHEMQSANPASKTKKAKRIRPETTDEFWNGEDIKWNLNHC